MANFTTHIGVGTLVSGMLATLTLAADVVAPENIVAVAAAGVLGSIMPDIDLKDSRPSRALFSGLAVFFSFVVLFLFAGKYSVAELWILALITFLGVRYGAGTIFHRMSYHRGIYHSILAGLFFAFLTAVIYARMLGRPDGVAWLAGGFMFVGYLVHLTLDELYSVDVMGTRIKASFGTALKLFDYKKLGHSLAMATATVLVFLVTPPTRQLTDGLASRSMWVSLQHKMLPKSKWFGILNPPWGLAYHGQDSTSPHTGDAAVPENSAAPAQPGPADSSVPISTGSIVPPQKPTE